MSNFVRVSTSSPSDQSAEGQQQDQQQPEAPQLNRVYNGVTRVTYGQAPQHIAQAKSDNSAPSTAGIDPNAVAASAQTGWGSYSARLPDSSTVELVPGDPGSRTSVKVAERMGLPRRQSDGTYIPTAMQQPQPAGAAPARQPVQQQAPQREPHEAAPVPLDVAVEADIAKAIDVIGEPAFTSAASAAAIANATGDADAYDRIAEGLARAGRMSQQDALALVSDAHAVFEQQVSQLARSEGVDDAEAMYAWAQRYAKSALVNAVNSQVLGRDLSGWRAITRAYLKATR